MSHRRIATYPAPVLPLVVLLCLLDFAAQAVTAPLALAGEWRFELDRADVGVQENWFTRNLAEKINLPGILQAQGYGDEISTNTPWVLSLYDKLWFQREDYKTHTQSGNVRVPFVSQPPQHYLGAAWYQRDIEIPKEWEGRRVVLFLERTRWETRAWLDNKLIGTNNSLCTPHEFDFGIVTPGKHRLTVRVDNRMLMNYRPDAHAVSDSLGSTWNGIVGKIELRSTPPVWIEEARVFTDANNDVRISVKIGNLTGRTGKGVLSLGAAFQAIQWDTNGVTDEFIFSLGKDADRWDEFHPTIQRYSLRLQSQAGVDDQRELSFGLREFKTSGPGFVINGRPTHLRGTHHGGDFPLTGYPPCDVEYWRKLFKTCKEWGLNHVRFHSFCPPEAAFTAADEIGIYLQPEPGMWNEISPGTPMEKMLHEETGRMIKYYGNHPSFVMVSASNEPKGRWQQSLPKWAEHFRAADPRRLYTTGTGHTERELPNPGEGADYLAVQRIGPSMLRRETAWFGRDYARSLRGINMPVVSHEVGQWCAYPDFDVIKKFTGFIRPGNYEIFRDSAAATGVLKFNKQFAHASGRFQLACYKEEIEANLRTPGLGGFQLLDLHDYTGQGTALVGLLDPFWEEKSYVKADEWRQFCGATVPLARLTKRVFTTAEKLDAEIEVTHYGQFPLTNAVVSWSVTDAGGNVVTQAGFAPGTPAIGRNAGLGKASVDLSKLPAPGAYRLRVTADVRRRSSDSSPANPLFTSAATNDWTFWLYPAQVSMSPTKDVLVTSSWNEAEQKLADGGKVLFLPRNADLDWSSPPLDNIPVFWNRLMNPQWGRMLGLWCDTNHPALAGFPTGENCDWQWTQITRGTRAVNVGKLPRELKPIVAAIDDWNRNWKLAPIFEARVGQGKLLVCSFDLNSRLDERVVARQLRRSLLDYVAGDKFQPQVSVTPERMRNLWFDTFVMRKLGATADNDAQAAFDGDPNTFWSVGGGRGSPRRHPYELTISFTNTVAMNGVVVMNRQNDRDHLGDIRDYALELSDDGQVWRQVTAGTLASTWNPQTIPFSRMENARHLRLTARSGYEADASVALAEIAVLYAGPPLPENSAATIQYQRVRSTSGDVDEGPAGPPATTP